MPKRYSQEETKQIRDLVAQGLSNMEIAQRLERAIAGIRNIRHRLKLKAGTQNQLQSLLRQKEALEKKVQELRSSQTQETRSWVLCKTKDKKPRLTCNSTNNCYSRNCILP
jgi:DNA-binding NarL/FixJ family response regulator